MKDFFFINNSKQFLCCAHSNVQKRKPVPISRHLRENSLPLPLRGEQKYKPKAALIKLLFEIPAPLTECTRSYTSRGFAPSWQSRTQLEEKVTLFTVVSVYETLPAAHLQCWQELRVHFCGSLSAAKPQLLWDYPQQCPVPVLVQPGSDGQGKHSLEKWSRQKCHLVITQIPMHRKKKHATSSEGKQNSGIHGFQALFPLGSIKMAKPSQTAQFPTLVLHMLASCKVLM